MPYVKLMFTPHQPIEDEDSAVDSLWDYLSCLYKNGQILESYEIVKSAGSFLAFATLPESDSLDEKHNNIYVSKYVESVKQLFIITVENIGENLDTMNSCLCEEGPLWYMLYSDWTDEESPVVCGNCGRSVPLYKLPHILMEDEHHGVLGWKQAYRDVDGLYIYCLSDRFTYRQMHDVNSRLSKDGRDICKAFEDATGIPFYYYLFHHKKTPVTCPVCGKGWKLTGDKTFIDYKCEKCRLVADEA